MEFLADWIYILGLFSVFLVPLITITAIAESWEKIKEAYEVVTDLIAMLLAKIIIKIRSFKNV